MKKLSGFSLVEMALVIATSGMVAAVAVPRFIDVAGDTQKAATESLAALLNSASVMNFAKERAEAMSGVAVTACDDAGRLLEDASLLSGYRIASATIDGEEGTSVDCTLHGPDHTAAHFRAIKVDPTS